ncbi:hypothetical protein [Ureibacillus sp. FSL W8-0352]|uniref:hypothetical protein n=1 Tax=Ureibacillus sp. FSL W8-0352 TaxID=2954596 RepID=UPI0030F7AA1E
MDLTLEGFKVWFFDQVEIALAIILIILLFVTAYKRAWMAMIGVVLGLAILGIFIVNDQAITSLASWLAEKLGMGGGN